MAWVRRRAVEAWSIEASPLTGPCFNFGMAGRVCGPRRHSIVRPLGSSRPHCIGSTILCGDGRIDDRRSCQTTSFFDVTMSCERGVRRGGAIDVAGFTHLLASRPFRPSLRSSSVAAPGRVLMSTQSRSMPLRPMTLHFPRFFATCRRVGSTKSAATIRTRAVRRGRPVARASRRLSPSLRNPASAHV